MPDVPFDNGEGRCNNPSCPNPKIWWSDKVLNADTGKKLPLNEPFTGLRPPQIHGCMEKYRPGVFLDKYGNREKEEDPIIAGIRYSKEMWMWPKWVIKHRLRCLELGCDEGVGRSECDNEDCPCHWIEGLKDIDLKEESDRKHREWMEKWESQPLSFERFK